MRFDGNKLKALRESRRFDQTTLAMAARKYASGMNQSQISRYETTDQQPTVRNAAALAKALGVPVSELYEDEDEATRESAGADDDEDDAVAELLYAIRRVVRAEIKAGAR